ncbi:MAG: DNA polymerase III subunit alpha [Elusimicrobiota bacterium]
MPHSQFVHLHNHTEYSLLDGACRILDDRGKPGELIQTVANQFKMPALAITDHGNMYGAIEFYMACRVAGIKPIIGCEVYVAPGSRLERATDKVSGENYYHLTLLARDMQGYQNLMKLVSIGFLEGFYYKPRVDKEVLRQYSKGLVAMSGCLAGEVAAALLQGKIKDAERIAYEYRNIFEPGMFYIELMDNGLEEQKKVIPLQLELAKKTDIPIVATNDCHFLKKEDAFNHDVLLCIGTGKTLDEPDRLKFSSDLFYYRPPQEMIQLFSHSPEAVKNTVEIAEKCSLEIKFDKLYLPDYPVPAGKTAEKYLDELCGEGLKKRYAVPSAEHTGRLEHELSIINKMGFAPYFLIVWDFIKYAKSGGIPVGPGRGSGAGSIVAYVLGITDICPLKYGLLFERFLNPERHTMPDLDIDFADTGRDRVIEYVRNKYGQNNCAQIITFGSMQARLVIRDVARALGFAVSDADRIAKLIPFGSNIYSAMQSISELKSLARTDEKIAKLIDVSRKLEGLKRHTGVHAAGMVIAKDEITKFSPLSKGSRDIITTQYDGDQLSKLGLLKVDFLGLRTLTVLDDTVEMIKKRGNKDFSLSDIPLDDKKTFKLFHEARTLGIFQLESRGMRDLLRKLKPTDIEDIIALISLYRPGPMGSGMIDDFVARKHQRVKVKYEHPLLEPILKDTYGVIVYQEQVMRIAVDMAGFTAGQADTLRRAMSKKIPEEMEKYRDIFLQGAHKNNVDRATAVKVFEQMAQFAGYGFNKSHAAAYGIVAFQTAYCKANYPIEYMTALLNSEIGRSAIGKEEEESKSVTYIQECESVGIKIFSPDIQSSDVRFAIEGDGIKFGLLAVKNVGDAAIEGIIAARKENGEFKSWEDFLSRVDVRTANRKVLESLIKAGAFDCFGESHTYTRAELVTKLDMSLDWANSRKQDLSAGQGLLFGASDMARDLDRKVKFEPWSEHTTLANEREVLGFYLSGHPLAQHRHDLMRLSQYRLDRLPPPPQGQGQGPIIRVAGMITSAKKLVTKQKKEQYARFKLEDLHGEIEIVVLPRNYGGGLSKYIVPNSLVVVKGRFSGSDGQAEILAEQIMTFEEAKQKLPVFSGKVKIKLSSAGLEDGLLDKIKKVITEHPGTSPVILEVLVHGQGEYIVDTDMYAKAEEKFFHEVDKILGSEALELVS